MVLRAAPKFSGWSSGMNPRPIGDVRKGKLRVSTNCRSSTVGSDQRTPFPMMSMGRSARTKSSAARLTWSGWPRGGAIHLHGHFGDALEHRHVFRLLEGPGATPLLGTRASEDEQGQAVVVRDVGPGHTIGDPRSGGQHSD